MNESDSPSATVRPAVSLSRLFEWPLEPRHLALKSAFGRAVTGSPVWQAMKLRLVHEALALAEVCPRFRLVALDAVLEFRLLFELRCPVPTMPGRDGQLVVRERALLGLSYPEEAMRGPVPGTRFVTLLQPGDVWLANCAPAMGPLCLGPTIGPSVSLASLVMMTFSALTLQSFEIDLASPAGLIQPAAAEWWQQAVDRIPLTRAPFIADPEVPV